MENTPAQLLWIQTLLTLFLEFSAWAIARRRFDGLIQGRKTTFCVAAEQTIAAVGVIILVQAAGLWSQIAIGVAGVAGAIIGWEAAKAKQKQQTKGGADDQARGTGSTSEIR